MKIFKLPDLGEGLAEAEIREWYVKEGDEVIADKPMVAMETAKAVVDIPAPRSGRIQKLYGKVGDIIKTHAPLVEFEGSETETVIEPATSDAGTVVGAMEVTDKLITDSALGVRPKRAAGATVQVMPAIRMLAKKLSVDLDKVTGSGPNGRITEDDVQKAALSPAAGNLTAGYEALHGVRRVMAQIMSQSHQQIVPVTIVDDADIHAWPTKTDITLRVIRAIIHACQKVPELNAWFDTAHLARKLHQEIHLGLALDSVEGLFVPVLKNIAQTAPADLRAKIDLFKEQVKSRTIPQDDLRGATIMLSNFGTFAGRYASPIIAPPCVAIIGTGRLREEVVAYNGKPEIHKVLPLSLSMDHRAVTGGEAARFLAALIEDLQQG